MFMWRKRNLRRKRKSLKKARPNLQKRQSALVHLRQWSSRFGLCWWMRNAIPRIFGLIIGALSISLLVIVIGVQQPIHSYDGQLHIELSLPQDSTSEITKSILSGAIFVKMEIMSVSEASAPEPFKSLLRLYSHGPPSQMLMFIDFWRDSEFTIPVEFTDSSERIISLNFKMSRALDVDATVEKYNYNKVELQLLGIEENDWYPYAYRISGPIDELRSVSLHLERPLSVGKGLAHLDVWVSVDAKVEDFEGLRYRLANTIVYDPRFDDLKIAAGMSNEYTQERIRRRDSPMFGSATVERTFDGEQHGYIGLVAKGTHAQRQKFAEFLTIALGAIFGVAITWVLDPRFRR